MHSLDIKIYELFKKRFNDAEASMILEYFEAKTEEKINQKKELFITAKDKETLLTIATAKEFFASKEDLARLELKLAETKADTIKWMFIFWIGSTIATLGGLIAIVKFMIVK